jgi:predicted nucleotidyltransferase
MKLKLPLGYKKAINKIKALKENDRYLGAYVFGSVARGEITQESDLDVKVVVGEDNLCKNINHPFIDGIKLDISFLSLEQLKESTEQEIKKGDRIPMVAEPLVVFDKTGELKKLRSFAKKVISKMNIF